MHIKRIHEMEEKLTEIALCEINKGIECVNTAEMGAVIDMIKDLACAEKEAREAKEIEKEEEDEKKENEYFLKMLKEEYGEEEGEKRFYDNYRYKSSGRFAPKGRGSYMPRGGRRGYDEPPYYHTMPDYRMDLADYKGKTAEELRDMDRQSRGVMYFSSPMSDGNTSRNAADTRTSASGGNVRGYSDGYDEGQRRGYAEGYEQGNRDGRSQGSDSRYDRARRGYEEKKEMNKGNSPQENSENMKGLEELLNVVGGDVKELSPKMSPSEKAMTAQKFDTWSKMLKQ